MRLSKYNYIFVAALVLSFFQAGICQAKPVYKWKDEGGTVHFSNKAPSKNAKPAKLPDINRGEVKLVKKKLVSCSKHGGVDCQAGADSDGSVICYDGFRASSIRYRFSCSTPKLEISEISQITPEGNFKVFIRNSKAVKANKPAVIFRPNSGPEVKLMGPIEIEPFGIAEFEYQAREDAEQIKKVSLANLNITCANC